MLVIKVVYQETEFNITTKQTGKDDHRSPLCVIFLIIHVKYSNLDLLLQHLLASVIAK